MCTHKPVIKFRNKHKRRKKENIRPTHRSTHWPVFVVNCHEEKASCAAARDLSLIDKDGSPDRNSRVQMEFGPLRGRQKE